MGLPDRIGISYGSPSGGAGWEDLGDSFTLQNHGTISATTSVPGPFVIYTVTRRNPFVVTGGVAQTLTTDFLPSNDLIQTCYGFQVTASVVQAALSNLTMQLSIYRAAGAINANAGSGATTVTLTTPLTQTIPSGATITFTKADGSASTTSTLSAAAPGGQAVLNFSSTNLTGYNTGSIVSYQVGNTWGWGWTGGSGGTPAFPANVSIMAPANTPANNSALVAAPTGLTWGGTAGLNTPLGGIALQEGDALVLNTVTSSSTATVQVLNIQPLIT